MKRVDYKLGEQITDVETSAAPGGVTIAVRLKAEVAQRLYAEADASGRKLSDLVLEAVERYFGAAAAPSGTAAINGQPARRISTDQPT